MATFSQETPRVKSEFTTSSAGLFMKTSTEKNGTIHSKSFTIAEIRGYANHMNQKLDNDEIVKSKLPLPMGPEIFEALADGLILCRFLDHIEEGCIPSTIKVRPPKNAFEQNILLESAIKASTELGLTTINMGARDFKDGNVPIVLGLVWQLVKKSLLQDVGDTGEYGPEEILLRWFNENLEEAGHHRRVNNFSSDLKDSENYTILLNHLTKDFPQNEQCSLIPLQEKDLLKRAEQFLQQSEKIKARDFLTPEDIVEGNHKMNLAFLANLFSIFHETAAKESTEETEEEEDNDLDIDKMEKKIQEMKKEIEKVDREAKFQEEVLEKATRELQAEEERLRREIESQNRVSFELRKKQDEDIQKLREQLANVKTDDNALEKKEILEKIQLIEKEKLQLAKEQEGREEELEDLRNQLEDKTEERITWERRKQHASQQVEETRRRHKLQIERMKKRLQENYKEEERLEEVKDEAQKELDKTEDSLFNTRRKLIQVNNELKSELTQKERIAEAKNKVAEELRKAQQTIETQKETTREQRKKKTQLTTKLMNLHKNTTQLTEKKIDTLIDYKIENENVEEKKEQLHETEMELNHLKQKHNHLETIIDEAEDELEEVIDSKKNDKRTLENKNKVALKQLDLDQKKKLSTVAKPLKMLEEQKKEKTENIMEVEQENEQEKLKSELLKREGTNIAAQLFTELEKTDQIKKESKQTDKELKGKKNELEKEQKDYQSIHREQKKLSLTDKKNS